MLIGVERDYEWVVIAYPFTYMYGCMYISMHLPISPCNYHVIIHVKVVMNVSMSLCWYVCPFVCPCVPMLTCTNAKM